MNMTGKRAAAAAIAVGLGMLAPELAYAGDAPAGYEDFCPSGFATFVVPFKTSFGSGVTIVDYCADFDSFNIHSYR